MRNYLIKIYFVLAAGIFIVGCSDLQTNIPAEKQISGAHQNGFAVPASNNFHGKFLKSNNWDMQKCQQCHAADFSGGLTNSSCNTCHTAPGGPLACNTCHGDFSDPTKIAPPRAINGDTTTTYAGVGAHSNHLYTNKIGNKVECNNCHTVPSSVFEPGHLDSQLPAEVKLSGIANQGIASNAAYNPSDNSCSNTYCHGNFEFSKADADPTDQWVFTEDKIVGNNQTVIWTSVNSGQAKCGSCHDLPPKGHLGFQEFPISSCSAYHQGVVDQYGNIIDKEKHINGVANSRGN